MDESYYEGARLGMLGRSCVPCYYSNSERQIGMMRGDTDKAGDDGLGESSDEDGAEATWVWIVPKIGCDFVW